MEQEIADALEDLLLELTTLDLNLVQYLGHHVTLPQSADCFLVLDLFLEQAQLLAGTQVVALFLQEFDLLEVAGNLLEHLQALGHAAVVNRAELLCIKQGYQVATFGLELVADGV